MVIRPANDGQTTGIQLRDAKGMFGCHTWGNLGLWLLPSQFLSPRFARVESGRIGERSMCRGMGDLWFFCNIAGDELPSTSAFCWRKTKAPMGRASLRIFSARLGRGLDDFFSNWLVECWLIIRGNAQNKPWVGKWYQTYLSFLTRRTVLPPKWTIGWFLNGYEPAMIFKIRIDHLCKSPTAHFLA